MLVSIVTVAVIVALCSNCQKTETIDEGPLSVTQKLIKSFTTSDTMLFYSAIENDSVVNYMNSKVWHKNENIYSVRKILFFRYAPFKLAEKERLLVKGHPFPFSHFELGRIKRNEGTIEATVRWGEIYNEKYNEPFKSLILTLYEKQVGSWKIKAIDFPADSVTGNINR
jgi:hypothetical protein